MIDRCILTFWKAPAAQDWLMWLGRVRRGVLKLSAALVLLTAGMAGPSHAQHEAILSRSFIYETAPFPSCHASTVVETPAGDLVAAWFGGTDEGADDVEIWTSRKPAGEAWTTPAAVTDIPEMPTWNPVLYQDGDETRLYFKIGPSPREWIGAYRVSTDGGTTWGSTKYLPAGLTGPIRSKPIRLTSGALLAGTSFEAGYDGDSPGDAPYRAWTVWMERSEDDGDTWSKHGPVVVPGEPYGVIQPTLWQSADGVVHALMRSTARVGRICAAKSFDDGRTWSPAVPTALPNPNSAIDVVRMHDGRLALVYNHVASGRTPIHIAISSDDGATWSDPIVLEDGPGEYSYPAVIQTHDGLLHVTYTWKRERIRHVAIDPSLLPD